MRTDRRIDDRQTDIQRERDRQRVTTNLIVAFHNCTNAPRCHEDFHQAHTIGICNSLHTYRTHFPTRLLQLLTTIKQSDTTSYNSPLYGIFSSLFFGPPLRFTLSPNIPFPTPPALYFWAYFLS